MPKMSQVLMEHAIGMLMQECAPELLPDKWMLIALISRLQRRFREFGSASNRPHNRKPRVWHCVGEWFADVNVVNRVAHGGVVVVVWACMSHGQWTQLHFNLWQFKCTEIPWRDPEAHCRAIHVARICTQFLYTENVPVLPWPVHSPDTLPTFLFPPNIQPLCTAYWRREWNNIPRATIKRLINTGRCEREVSHCTRLKVVTPDNLLTGFLIPRPFTFCYI